MAKVAKPIERGDLVKTLIEKTLLPIGTVGEVKHALVDFVMVTFVVGGGKLNRLYWKKEVKLTHKKKP